MTRSAESNLLTLAKPWSTWVITQKSRQQSPMTLLIKSTHTFDQSLVKHLVKPYVNPNALEHLPELFPRYPNFT
jgi:hypothetical protein